MFRTPTTVRYSQGFTLIELLVVVIIIAILAAVALPKFVDTQKKARNTIVKANMHNIQITAEAYARDHGGLYPATPPNGKDEWSTYFPGGSAGLPTLKSGAPLKNPFTDKSMWSDILVLKLNSPTVDAEKNTSPAHASVVGALPGQIGYAAVADSEGKITSYAIEGIDSNGTAVAGDMPNSTLVLTNQ